MAKLQRWRSSRSAGEGTSPVEREHEEFGEVDELDGLDLADPEADDESASVEEGVEESLQEDDAPLEIDGPDDGLDAAPEETEESDDLDEDWHPSSNDVQRAGFLGWLTRGTHPREWIVISLLQAAHLKQALVTALAMGLAAILTGRPARESGVIVLTVLVGCMILGWHNDLTDKRRDIRHKRTGKPLADGRLSSGAVVYAMVAGGLVLLPLAFTTGITAGCIYMASVAIGMLGNIVLRTGSLSFWSWAVSYGMLPYYLSYGGWGGQFLGSPANTSIVILAALLGVGIHFTRAVWGLVADHEDGWTYLPLKLGMRLGATRLLALSSAYIALILVLLAVFGAKDGLSV